MNNQLRNMMAEIESWETAVEFRIPEELWAGYQIRSRSDDLYIASLASIFDALRLENKDEQKSELSAIAKTLVIYSRSAAAEYLSGVEKKLNQLYSAALYYLADFPATATFLVRKISNFQGFLDEELFLHNFLARELDESKLLDKLLIDPLNSAFEETLAPLINNLKNKQKEGLISDPRLFIATKLALHCTERFEEFNVWNALQKYAENYTHDLWQPFLRNSNAFPIWELFPSQLSAIESGILSDSNETFSLQMPTSSGKTSLCEVLIYHEVKARNKRVLFLVPFRALASEIREGISKRLESSGVSVVASHGGNIPTRSETATVETADVLIITPEKFMALTQTLPNLEDQFQTIICDEGHLIDDDSRGLQYELLLTKLRGIEIGSRKIVFISAILPNVNEIHEWLGGKPDHLATSDYKPVETDYAFLVPVSQSNDNWQLDVNPIYARPQSYFLDKFLVKNDFRYLNPDTGRQKLISGYNSFLSLSCASALKARRNGPVALFTTTKGDNGVKGLVKKILDMCEFKAKVAQGELGFSEQLPELIEYIAFQFGQDHLLPRLLKYEAGFHHGGLPQEIRREMEDGIQNGTISILICTNTLAEGVNLPIRTLVAHTVKRYDGENSRWRYLENRSIKNIIGRVGRAGKETRGRVIFANNSERVQIERVLRDQFMEPAHGALYNLISRLENFVSTNNIQLRNDVFENQQSWFLTLIDKIDLTLIDLIPPDMDQEAITSHIEEMLERTLANRYCTTDQLQGIMKTVFRLRAENLQQSVPRDSWPLLRKSGSPPRFWASIVSLELLENSLWQTLTDPLEEAWLNEVILQLRELSNIDLDIEHEVLLKFIRGWISGFTYIEISGDCEISVDDVLDLVCNQIGFHLQDPTAKLCQLAIEKHGEDALSETARNWSSLLQYGLMTMQQLDLFERGASDRLAVWGVSRFLETNHITLRENDLVRYLRVNRISLKEALDQDTRVPQLSSKRIFRELRINSN